MVYHRVVDGLFTNRSDQRDFVESALARWGQHCEVQIASAFFSNAAAIQSLVDRGCNVNLVVRLASGTSPDELAKALRISGVHVRYFTGDSFHPKLFVFGGSCALIGSANLTHAGMKSNAEVSVTLGADDPRFDECVRLIVSYWDEAKVLDLPTLNKFRDAIRANNTKPDGIADQAVEAAVGKHTFANIRRTEVKVSKSVNFVDGYRRRYQVFLHAFDVVREQYAATGRRKVSKDQLPLRIEIDQFCNWIVEKYARGEDVTQLPILRGQDLSDRIAAEIQLYQNAEWPYLTESIVDEKYPQIVDVLGDVSVLQQATIDEIYEALLVVHAFHDRFRFFDGGFPTMKKRFIADNPVDRVKKTLQHLLFGSGDYVRRMADCIFEESWTLHHFGESCVQETYGWVNDEDVPICNGRTLKSLRWLGFPVHVTG